MYEISVINKDNRRKQREEQFKKNEDNTPILFTTGNVGFKLSLTAGLFEECISVFIEPVVISPETGSWEGLQTTREFLIPLEKNDPLLYYSKRPYDHLQWGDGSVKVFWRNEGLEITLINKKDSHNDFILVTRKFLWDGFSYIENSNARKVKVLAGTSFYNPLKNGLTRENYEERVISFNSTDEEYSNAVRRIYRKDILNKILSKFGLQLIE